MDILFLILINVIPAMIVFFGHVFIKHPPKSINFAYGYRTKRSTASKAAWGYAHQVCGRLWYKGGIFLVILINIIFITTGLFFSEYLYNVFYILFLIPLAYMLFSIFYTEIKLKQQFEKGAS